MDNKVYYGEYSLKHWIDLILKKNITLPDYQRYFVWKEDSVQNFIKSLKNKQYIPPVTIGALKIKDKQENLILDGQQRLTSILLAYIKIFPDREKYEHQIRQTANENDDEENKTDDNEMNDIIKWTFKTYLEEKDEDKEGYYHTLDLKDLETDFFDTTFLGFSYLVPEDKEASDQQKYYSTVFRNINVRGEHLLTQESRRSLYFLDSDLAAFFEPEFCKELTINNSIIDFVRYLSLLSQYFKEKRVSSVARYYGRKMEEYYEEYIYSVAGEDKSPLFNDFEDIFPEKKFALKYEKLQQKFKELSINNFSSIIDSDMYLFGLIYIIVFENKDIDKTKIELIQSKLDKKIEEYKNINTHKKTPSALKYLRIRIEDSIGIYKRYTL